MARFSPEEIERIKHKPTVIGNPRKLDCPLPLTANEQELLVSTVNYYHDRLKSNSDALGYLEKRSLTHAEIIDRFKIGFVDLGLLDRGLDRARWHHRERSPKRVGEPQIGDAHRRNFALAVDIVAYHLDAGEIHRRADGSAQHVEMPALARLRLEVRARLDHRLAPALRGEAALDGGEDLAVGEVQLRNVRAVEEGDVEGRGGHAVSFLYGACVARSLTPD